MTCEHVNLSSTRDVVGVVKLRTLKWGGYGSPGWAQCNHKGSLLEQGGRTGESEGARDGAHLVRTGLCCLQVEEGTTGQESGGVLGAGKDKKWESPLDPPEGMQPCQHLDFWLLKL